MRALADQILASLWPAFGGSRAELDRLTFTGEGQLPSAFPVTDFAAASVAAAALAVARLAGDGEGQLPEIRVDRRLVSLWFGFSIQPVGWAMPPPWDPIAGDYRAADGWIRLHTNAPHHRAAAIAVLACREERTAVAAAVAGWAADDLEAAIVSAGGCAAVMRSVEAWAAHPQGGAVAAEPLVAFAMAAADPPPWRPTAGRPLEGLKVLDLTRVLAGPVATRFLAGYGAEVLRIDPPGWDEPGVIPEVTLGKHCARLDLEAEPDRRTFERLLSGADVLVHGYRPGALEGLGYGEAARRAIRPDIVDVSLDAYGWSGPWAGRRGFDSLVQMSTGIAAAGMAWKGADAPTPLPVQALDQATGYLMAAAVAVALADRIAGKGAATARLSLARTAKLLTDAAAIAKEVGWQPSRDGWRKGEEADLAPAIEATVWGPARRWQPPATISGAPMRWDRPAGGLGSAEARWPE